MSENAIDFETLNLDEAFGGDFVPEPETAVQLSDLELPEAAGEETTPDPQAEPQPEEEAKPEKPWNPDGPGKPSVALRKEREENKALKAERDRLAAEKAEFERQLSETRAQQEQAQQQQRYAQEQATYERLLEEQGPEAAQAYANQINAQRQAEYAQQQNAVKAQYDQQRVQERAALSVEFARETYADFDDVVGKLMASPDAQFINWAVIDSSPNPGKALYEYAKRNLPVDREALKAELLAELKQQLTPAKPKAPPTLAKLPAAAPNDGDGALDLNNLTKADFQKHGLNLLDLIG